MSKCEIVKGERGKVSPLICKHGTVGCQAYNHGPWVEPNPLERYTINTISAEALFHAIDTTPPGEGRNALVKLAKEQLGTGAKDRPIPNPGEDPLGYAIGMLNAEINGRREWAVICSYMRDVVTLYERAKKRDSDGK